MASPGVRLRLLLWNLAIVLQEIIVIIIMAIIVIFFSFLFGNFCFHQFLFSDFVFLVIAIDIFTKTSRYLIHIFTSSATPSSSPDWQLPSFFQQSALNHQFVRHFVNNNIKPRSVSDNTTRLVQFFLQGDNIVGQSAHHFSSLSLVSLYHSALQGLSD